MSHESDSAQCWEYESDGTLLYAWFCGCGAAGDSSSSLISAVNNLVGHLALATGEGAVTLTTSSLYARQVPR